MSGIFGKSSNLPASAQLAFGLQATRANTNQQARPVPLVYGQQRLSLTFISDVFDILASPVNQSVGKQSQQVGTNYYASFAGIVCMGAVDGIYDLLLNGQPVFASTTLLYAVSLTAAGSDADLFMTATFQTANPHGLATGDVVVVLGVDQPEYDGEFTITVVSPTQFQFQITATDAPTATSNQSGAITAQVRLDPVLRDDTNPDFADITIPDYCTMRIYWGTETQPQDNYLNTVSGVVHPAYLGQCYIVFHQLFFGFNQTNVPNVEVVVARAPKPDWASLDSGAIQNDANPAYVIADMYQNPRSGLALSDDEIDTEGLDAAAQAFSNENLGVSQAITRLQDLRSQLKLLCETIDALPILSTEGLLSLLPIRPPAGGEPILTDSDLSDLPNFTPQDWTTTYTDTKVIFSDASIGFQDNLAEWRDVGVRNVVQNPDVLSLDRRWITRADLAQAIANASGQAAAVPTITGKLKLCYNDDLFAALAPGALFQINFSLRPAPNLFFRVVVRSIASPDQPEFEIEFQADRTYLYTALLPNVGQSQVQLGLPHVPPLQPVSANTRLRLVELPPGLCNGAPAIAVIAARSSTASTNFSVWLNKNYAWEADAPNSYALVQTQTSFALHGVTTQDYPATTRLIDLELGVSVQWDGPDVTLEPVTAFDALANVLLAFIDDEILSLADWSLIGPGAYRLKFVRGRYGSTIADHAPGAKVLLVNRANLAIVSHPEFQPGNTAQCKLTIGAQAVSAGTELDLVFAGLAWRVPPPCALAVNGNSFNAVFPGGVTPFTVSWVLPDPGAVLPRFDQVKLSTRLQFLVAGNPIAQTDIPWPLTSAQFTFGALNGGVDADFTIVALTVSNPGWQQIPSGSSTSLNVLKYP